MKTERVDIYGIPALVFGAPSEKAFIYVHGRYSRKEYAADFAEAAAARGYQTLAFDLAAHGERENSPVRCDVFTGISDLRAVYGYAARRFASLSLFACSLGAFFSLCAYNDITFRQALFQSPIVNMQGLIVNMLKANGITLQELREKGEIITPSDIFTEKYYDYTVQNPPVRWSTPTAILYGGRDDLQSRANIAAFAKRFSCVLTVEENCGHSFMDEGDGTLVRRWLNGAIA